MFFHVPPPPPGVSGINYLTYLDVQRVILWECMGLPGGGGGGGGGGMK